MIHGVVEEQDRLPLSFVPILEYQTPGHPDASARVTWWLAPIVIVPAAGFSLFALMISGHVTTLPLVALSGPCIVPLLLLSHLPDEIFSMALLLAVTGQYSLYFAAFRSRHRGLIRSASSVHIAGAIVAYFLV